MPDFAKEVSDVNIKKFLSSNYYKAYFKLHEKVQKIDRGGKIRYIYFEKDRNSNRLIVCFSGFAGHYERGRYNYVRSLSKSKSYRLFIRDDFGFRGVGSYYLGDSCALYKHSAIQNLIRTMQKPSVRETVFVGSSKGGSAALLYGIMMGADRIIIGSPQYRIGDYLQKNDYHREILNCIVDRRNGFDENWLNGLIDFALDEKPFNGEITLIYSSKEGGYQEDTIPLIDTLKTHNIRLNLHDELFEDHSQVGRYFSKYLSEL